VDSGDGDVIADPPTHALPLPVPLLAPAPASPASAPSPDLAVEVAAFVSSLALRPTPQTTRYDQDWQNLSSAPFHILDRGPRLTSIFFADGRSRILDTAAVNAFVRMTTHVPAPPPGSPPPRLPRSLLPPVPRLTTSPPLAPTIPFFSPAPSPAFTWHPAPPPTPYHEPDSPPTPLITYSPHRDITYQHGSPDAAHQSSSAPASTPLAPWRQAQAEEDARPVVPTPWKKITWGTTADTNQEHEPWGRAPHASSDSSPHSYAHTRSAHRPPASHASSPRSSFRGGTTVIATASARDLSDPDPVAILPILVGLDSYSDITVAAPELVYNKRKIT
jgi:hypothetical protein